MSKSVVLLALAAFAWASHPAVVQAQPAADPSGGPDTRQLSVQQTQAFNAGVPTNTISLEAAFDRPNGVYGNGEHVRLAIRANQDAYVTVVSVGPTGKVTQLFPNDSQPQNLVRANTPLLIPATTASAQIVVTPPFGNELIKVVASSNPGNLIPSNQLTPTGGFRSAEGGVEDLMRNLAVAATASGGRFAQQNLVLRTVATAPTAASPTPAPVPPAAPAQVAQAQPLLPPGPNPTAGLLPQMNNPLLLSIATDKHTYRVGERITLAVTSEKACSATVFDVNASGQARQVFPNKNTTTNAIPAMQMTMVSGGAAPTVIDARGPVGTGTLIVVCSTDTAPATVVAPDQTNIFTTIPSLEGLKKDFEQLSRRALNSTSISSISVTIQP